VNGKSCRHLEHNITSLYSNKNLQPEHVSGKKSFNRFFSISSNNKFL
jgi:hypothetical protein